MFLSFSLSKGGNLDNPIHTEPLDKEPALPQRLAQGTILSKRYAIEEVIGMGGMGAVYRARDLHFPSVVKWVAVKEMINPADETGSSTVMVQNFEREANILATLSHPAIPRIYDFFTHKERSYLVLEFIFGSNLEALLANPNFAPTQEQVVDWAIELCDVLHFLHNHQPTPIIFRDMKPSNVMVNQFNHVVLIDFGIAKAFKTGRRGTMVGTEGYSPPEQYRGEESPSVDIYALGATLHHLITRCNPQLEAPFSFSERPIFKYNPNASPELEAIINKSLAYKPEDRYQSADEMKQALVALTRRGRASVSVNTHQTAILENGEVRPLWKFDCEDEIRGTPVVSGGIVYIGAYDNNLYALDAESGNFLWKCPTKGAIVGRPAVESSFVYFGSEDRNVYLISAYSGKMLWSFRTDGPVRSSPRLRDESVMIGSDDGGLYAINVQKGTKMWRYETGAPVRSTPFHENNLLYFGNEHGDFFCLDLFSEMKWHLKAKRAVTSSPLVVEGMVLFTSMDGQFYAVDAQHGWAIWRFRMGKGSISSPYCYDGLAYAGSIDGNIYCLDLGNGREVWKHQTGHQVTGSPVVYKDAVYCGSVDGNIYSLAYKTGHINWKFSSGGPVTGTPVICEDVLYFGSTDRYLYALPVG